MKYRAHTQAMGRPTRFVYSQAAQLGIQELEVSDEGPADVVAGSHEIFRETGLSLLDLEVRGSILPSKRGGWFIASIDPRTPLVGPKHQGYRNMYSLTPMVKIDLARAACCKEPDVPLVHLKTADEVLALIQKAKPKYVSVDIEGHAESMHILGVGWTAQEAYVIAWEQDSCRRLLDYVMEHCEPILHNANYDIAELDRAGCKRPKVWEDTIVLAALYNPGIKKGLQTQTLSWVDGSVAWKGLVDHKQGFEYSEGKVAEYRSLWTTILTRLGRNVPRTPWHWYCFYNGLDVAYTFRLHAQLRQFLTKQGRIERYDTLEKPLQPYLVDMGLRGLPTNETTRKRLVRECRQKERDADNRLRDIGNQVLFNDFRYWQEETDRIKREIYAVDGKLTGHKEYQSARGKMTRRKANVDAGFNFDSTQQRAALVYDYLELPKVGKEGRSTKEEVLEELKLRLTRVDEDGNPAPVCKPMIGTIEEAVEILDALITGKKNATWRRNFLSMPLVEGPGWKRLQTEYHLHRTATGRLSSGTAKDDDDKKEKKQQLQNVPEHLREPVEADPGFVMVGGDWSNIEWAIVQWYAIRVPDSVKRRLGIPLDFHQKLLDRFLRGDLDAHRYLASVANDIEEHLVTKTQRKQVKPYTHGRNYYGSARTLARNAGHTETVGNKVCAAHKKAFKPHGWWEVVINEVRRTRRIETAYGWWRWFFDMDPKPTEALATQIQGTAADLCKWVLLRIFRGLPEGWEILTTTHDSILMQAPEQDKDRAVAWLKGKMEQPIPWLENYCFPAEVKAGRTWMDV